jgi:hypothetical protein
MDTLTDHISLEEFVASVSSSESNMTMHHMDTVANNSTENASLGMSTPHGGGALGSLSPSSTDTSLDKTTGRVTPANFSHFDLISLLQIDFFSSLFHL